MPPMPGNSPRAFREFVGAKFDKEVERYAGQWLAIASGEIVAHGKDPERVHDEGCKAGKGHPYMEYICAGPEEVPLPYYLP